jgi:hypothetical protein
MSDNALMRELFDRWERVWHEGQYDLIPSCVGSHYTRHDEQGDRTVTRDAMPPMPGSALVVIEPELVFRGLKAVLDRPPMAFDRHQRFDDVPAGHQVVKKARSPSAI